MALKGNLRDFTITQLLNLINLAQKTGTLVIESPNEAAWVTFRQGKLAYAQMGREDSGLPAILYRAKKLNGNQYKVIKERASNMSDKELGLLLINANYINQQDILNSLQMYFVNVVSRLFTWVEGMFRFENNVLPPDGKITLKINLENLIMEGSRRMRELERLQEEIPSLDMALKFVERPGTNIRSLNLSVEEWKVVSYINPKNTIRQIGRTARMNDLDIRKIVYGLLQAGLVELIRPQGAPPVPIVQPSKPTPENRAQQRSLIDRIIRRIRSL